MPSSGNDQRVKQGQPKRFYRLTDKGKAASDLDWQDPLQTLYGYPLWQRHGKPPPGEE
jgi:DNA-binding PadR family transcriptional regulator